MGENQKLYRPIFDDNEKHLVRSRENPGRYRGQSRDKDNKNPDFPEFEEVEVPDIDFEREKWAHEERMAEIAASQTATEERTTIWDFCDTVFTYFAENPEKLVAAIETIKKAKSGIERIKNNVVNGIQDRKKEKQSKNANANVSMKKGEKGSKEAKKLPPKDMVGKQQENRDKQKMSVEEARLLLLGAFSDYINLKNKLVKLSNARIDNVEMQQLKMEEMISLFEAYIQEYPKLMDNNTMEKFSHLINMNADPRENEKIMRVLGLNNGGLLESGKKQINKRPQQIGGKK